MTDRLLNDVRSYLEYCSDMGLKEIQVAKRIPAKKIASGEKRRPEQKKSTVGEGGKASVLKSLCGEIGDCRKCRLCEGRTNLVFGVGNPNADLMFIGEGPGHDEDVQGIPFVGRAGQLLTRIIEAMKMKRDDVYIANVVKCRPPQNRAPAPDEAKECLPFLVRQVEIIEPKAIVCLGAVAIQYFLGTERKISRIRGEWQDWRGIPVMPTYHPAFLLRNPDAKRPVWEDMQKVMQLLSSR